MKLAGLIVAVLLLGLVAFLQHEEIVALRGQRDRALAACDGGE
jgi:hypothetical protein